MKKNMPSQKGCILLNPAEPSSTAGQQVQGGTVYCVIAYDTRLLAIYAEANGHTLELNPQGAVEYRGGPIPGRAAMSMVYIQPATGRLVTVWDRRCFDSPDLKVFIGHSERCDNKSWANLVRFRGVRGTRQYLRYAHH